MIGKCVLWVSGIVNKQIEKVDHHNGYDFYMLKSDINKGYEYGMVFLEHDNHYFHISNNKERIKQYLDHHPNFDLLEMITTEFEEQLKTGARVSKGYAEYLGRTDEAKEAVRRYEERKETENRQREEERRQKDLEAHKAEQERLKKVEHNYTNGERIDADDFLALCDEHGVTVPIRTRGWIIKNLYEIGHNDGATSFRYSGNKSKSIGTVAANLYNALKELVTT